MADGRSTLDLFGDSFVLLQLGEAHGDDARLAAAAAAAGAPLKTVRIDEAAVVRLYETRLVLVRPDGHVAWRGEALPQDIDALVATVAGRGPGPGQT